MGGEGGERLVRGEWEDRGRREGRRREERGRGRGRGRERERETERVRETETERRRARDRWRRRKRGEEGSEVSGVRQWEGLMSLFPGEVGPCVYPRGQSSQTRSLRSGS